MPSWTRRSADSSCIPDVLQLLIARIEQLGLDQEGLYRVSGPHSQVRVLHAKAVAALVKPSAMRALQKELGKVRALKHLAQRRVALRRESCSLMRIFATARTCTRAHTHTHTHTNYY